MRRERKAKPMEFKGYKTSTEAKESLENFHGHKVTILGSVNTYANNVNSIRAAEAYVIHPDGSRGYEHTTDGTNWIPRERSIFDRGSSRW